MPPSDWEYSPKDALRLAAIRWFANAIENLSIELYASSPETFAQTEATLRQALGQLTLQRQHFQSVIGADECPDGYELCQGLCVPTCDTQGVTHPQVPLTE